MARNFLFVAAVFFTSCASAAVEEVHARGFLHLNGYSQHFAAPDANNQLFGLGVTWPAGPQWAPVTRAWEADVFQDSGRKLSGYVGHSWTVRRGRISVGITGAVMYHHNFAKHNRWSMLPVALPFAQFALQRTKLRAYYIPPVRNRCDHQIALQLLLPLPFEPVR